MEVLDLTTAAGPRAHGNSAQQSTPQTQIGFARKFSAPVAPEPNFILFRKNPSHLHPSPPNRLGVTQSEIRFARQSPSTLRPTIQFRSVSQNPSHLHQAPKSVACRAKSKIGFAWPFLHPPLRPQNLEFRSVSQNPSNPTPQAPQTSRVPRKSKIGFARQFRISGITKANFALFRKNRPALPTGLPW